MTKITKVSDFFIKINELEPANDYEYATNMAAGALLKELHNWELHFQKLNNGNLPKESDLKNWFANITDDAIKNKIRESSRWLDVYLNEAIENARPEIEKELESKIYKKLIASSIHKNEKQTKIWTGSNISFSVVMAIFIAFVAGIILKYNVLRHFVEFLEGILKSLNYFNF